MLFVMFVEGIEMMVMLRAAFLSGHAVGRGGACGLSGFSLFRLLAHVRVLREDAATQSQRED